MTTTSIKTSDLATTATTALTDHESKTKLDLTAWVLLAHVLIKNNQFALLTKYVEKFDLPADHWTKVILAFPDDHDQCGHHVEVLLHVAKTASLSFLKVMWESELGVIGQEDLTGHITFTSLLAGIVLRDDAKEAEKIMKDLLESKWDTLSDGMKERIIHHTIHNLSHGHRGSLKERCHLIRPLLLRWQEKKAIMYMIVSGGNLNLSEEIVRFFRLSRSELHQIHNWELQNSLMRYITG
jgi:hypothetical protein